MSKHLPNPIGYRDNKGNIYIDKNAKFKPLTDPSPKKNRHPDYTLKDQAAGRCPYCLASAEHDCDCEIPPKKKDWSREKLANLLDEYGQYRTYKIFLKIEDFISRLIDEAREEVATAYKNPTISTEIS